MRAFIKYLIIIKITVESKILTLLIFVSIFSFSCRKEVIILAGYGLDDWTAETHSSDVSPNYTNVFPQDKVNRLDIVIENNYWQVMQEDLAEKLGPGRGFCSENPIYIPCQIFYNDIQWYDVGIRYKGNSSLSASYRGGIKKLPFRLEFDHFEDENPSISGQTFYGFSQLSLGNNFKDVSLMHEKIATDVYRAFGVPASQSAFYRIFIDFGEGPMYFGLYTMVEIVFDGPMLINQFGNSSGNCYKPEGVSAKFNDINQITSEFFVNKTNPEATLDDVKSMTNALLSGTRTSNPGQWRTDLEAVFNVNMFLKWLAANTAMQNWDTYGQMSHNFYLYNDPYSELLTWIPWDNNATFIDESGGGGPGGNSYVLEFDFSNLDNSFPGPEGEHTWPLIRYLYDDSTYKSIYNDYIDEFINSPFSPAVMEERFTEAYNLIYPYVTGAEGEIYGYTFLKDYADFENSLNKLINFATNRYTEADNYLNQ